MLALFSLTVFLSAGILFLVQPMFAKMVLPLLGGSPGVWNTCMVFFQAMLLAGYLYSHLLTSRLALKSQFLAHLLVLAAPMFCLPISIRDVDGPLTTESPILWLLSTLAVGVGLPFFVVSTTNPLLQKWFAGTRHSSASDPYFLYAASNLGSMMALVGYPLVVEPTLPLLRQSHVWSGGYGLVAALLAGCGIAALRQNGITSDGPSRPDAIESSTQPIPNLKRRLRWIALSLVPSSLMLGVTNYISTDIASTPLFWVIPLAIYLLTFILVFARRPPIPHQWIVRAFSWLVLLVAITFVADTSWPLVILHLVTFFVTAMMCHGELARDRPDTRHLTEYYLWMSFGGVLGGMLNALVAPLVFPTVLEYPIAIVAASMLRPADPRHSSTPNARRLDWKLPIGLGLAMAAIAWLMRDVSLETYPAATLPLLGLPAAICFTFIDRPMRYALGLVSVMSGAALFLSFQSPVLHTARSFFGVHRVVYDREHGLHKLKNGGTFHGWQHLDPVRRTEPTAYYHRTGPIGDIFALLAKRHAPVKIGVTGLGTGGVVAHRQPGMHFTFFEIDPLVQQIAERVEFFTYLSDAGADSYAIVLGDGRLTLALEPDHFFNLLLLDAFSSDMIPVHLLTREAIEMYLDKLADAGVLVFNISNRFLDLEPVVGDLAAAIGLACVSRADLEVSDVEKDAGKAPSHYMALARRPEHFGELVRNPKWRPVQGRANARIWTDGYSNIISAVKW